MFNSFRARIVGGTFMASKKHLWNHKCLLDCVVKVCKRVHRNGIIDSVRASHHVLDSVVHQLANICLDVINAVRRFPFLRRL
jgi:hypothetical protein